MYMQVSTKECTGDRQEYHTDRTLHIIRNVQGTDFIIHMN